MNISLFFSKFCRSSVFPSTFPFLSIPNSCYPNTGSGTIILHVSRHLFNLQFLCRLKLPMQLKATTFSLNTPFWQHINYIQTTRQSQLTLHCFQNLVLITTCFGSPTIYIKYMGGSSLPHRAPCKLVIYYTPTNALLYYNSLKSLH